jgi:outer membrane lipoprotein-sorting protein
MNHRSGFLVNNNHFFISGGRLRCFRGLLVGLVGVALVFGFAFRAPAQVDPLDDPTRQGGDVLNTGSGLNTSDPLQSGDEPRVGDPLRSDDPLKAGETPRTGLNPDSKTAIETIPKPTPRESSDDQVLAELGPAPAEDPETSFTLLSATESRAFLEAMTATLRGVRSLRARFVQDRFLLVFTDSLRATGRCWFIEPNRIRWQIESPYYSLLIMNAGRVAKFDLQDGRLRKLRLGSEDLLRSVLEEIMGWMRGDFDKARERYDFELAKGPNSHRLRLKPRAGTMERIISVIELHVDSETKRVRRVVIREPEDDYIVIRFFEEEINPTLEDDLFDTNTPRR